VRSLALLFAVLALGLPAAARADDDAVPAQPAASPGPVATETPEPTPAPAAETPAPSPAPAVAPPQPAATPVPTATPTPVATAPAPPVRQARVRQAARRHVARRPLNQEDGGEGDTRVDSFFDGRITVGDATAADGTITVTDVNVRAKTGDDPALTITHAESTGGKATAHVVLRPPGGDPVETDVTLDPGQDLMDPANYAGDPDVADAFAQVGDALGTADDSGKPLQALTIVFGSGTPAPSGVVGAIGFSTNASKGRVFVFSEPPPQLVQNDLGGSDGAPRDERARQLYDDLNVAAVARVLSILSVPIDVVAVATAGACRAFAGENCGGKPAARVVQFVVALLHGATLLATPDGKLKLQVACPTGFGDVTGSLEIKTAPRIGEQQVTLGKITSFDCAKATTPITVELTGEAQRRLEGGEHIAVEVTVLARGGGHFDGDVVDLVLELHSS
jgi:hypothetical protein